MAEKLNHLQAIFKKLKIEALCFTATVCHDSEP